MFVVGTIKKNGKDTILISLGDYKGHAVCDLRIYYKTADGEYLPTPRGITFANELLPELIKMLNEAQKQMEVSANE
jgi:hypothetical protein